MALGEHGPESRHLELAGLEVSASFRAPLPLEYPGYQHIPPALSW